MEKKNKYNYLKVIYTILILIFINGNAFTQHYYFDQYSVKEGLAQSKVYSLIQDHDGYIWLGTASGVSRFDGVNFENYSTDHGIAENGVRVIFEDNSNNIWLGHIGGGLTKFNGTEFQEIKIDTLTISGDITSITEDDSGNIWIGSHGNGAFKISNSNKDISEWKIKNYSGQQKLSDRIFQILKNKKGKLLFIIDGGIKQYIKADDTFEFYFLKGIPQYFQFTTIYEDKNENLWIGTYNGGLYKWNKKTNTTDIFDIRDGLSSNFISTINGDKKGNIWIGTWGGGINKLFENKIKVYNKTNGLVDNEIRCITEDREGNILIGLNENGLAIFKGEKFISYTENDGLVNNQVSTIFQDKNGRFWFGTNSGISILNKTSEEQSVFSLNELLGKKDIFKKEVSFINEDKDNNIWIATKEDGVYSINESTKKIDYNPKLNYNVSRRGRGGIVTAMVIDKENALWIGTIDGIIYYDLNTGALANLSNIHGIAGNDISALYCDSKNNIWIGSKAKGITKVVDTLFTKIKGSRKLTIKSFTEDKNGKIWIGTESQGIFSIVNDSLHDNFRTKDGLLADYITLVKCDNNNSLWIGTNRGLNRLNFEKNKIIEYSAKSGFTGIEVKENASILDSEGNLWFGTVEGVFEYIQKNEYPNNLEPLTHITKLTVNLKDRKMVTDLVLNYPEKSIIFHYNSICLTNPEKVMYQVMLEGADEDWQPPTKQTFANYSPLPAGSYTFKVRASNNNGIWNKEPVTFHFTKKPPFWKTKLFYFIVIVILIIILVLFIKIRERSLIREKEILEGKVRERTKEVVEKNEELAKKNQNITDSIKYAKRIQQAMLPDKIIVDEYLKDAFILYKPKDIVSGDFYWIEKLNSKILFSAVDCTGHGVPGALMSVVGYNGLHRIVSEFKLSKPSDILNKLNELVKETLQSSHDSAVKDGMDMALCQLDRKKKVLEYAGAFNPLYIVSKKDKITKEGGETIEPKISENNYNLFEIKGSKQPIGAYFKTSEFINHTFLLDKNDSVYVFSDGYADQFGGPEGRKFMYKRLKKLLLSIQDEPMQNQKEILDNTINEWMIKEEQIDDICFIGVKI